MIIRILSLAVFISILFNSLLFSQEENSDKYEPVYTNPNGLVIPSSYAGYVLGSDIKKYNNVVKVYKVITKEESPYKSLSIDFLGVHGAELSTFAGKIERIRWTYDTFGSVDSYNILVGAISSRFRHVNHSKLNKIFYLNDKFTDGHIELSLELIPNLPISNHIITLYISDLNIANNRYALAKYYLKHIDEYNDFIDKLNETR